MVTAYHVVDSGEPILVERTIEVAAGASYVEAYPDVEVVAFDADQDLAVLRLANVRADHFTVLPLADAPVKDEAVLSYGFPDSSLSKAASMMSKPGKVLSLVKFPAYDRKTGTVIRENAVDGLLISADIEPGFSGGPTCDERGAVVGVNVTKDLVHRGQNGAVSVTAVTELLSHVKPAKDSRGADRRRRQGAARADRDRVPVAADRPAVVRAGAGLRERRRPAPARRARHRVSASWTTTR